MPVPVALSKSDLAVALAKLAAMNGDPKPNALFQRLVNSWAPWGTDNRRTYTVVRLYSHEVELFRSLKLPCAVQCNYEAVYADPDSDMEVTVYTLDDPPTRRTFRTGHGARKLNLIRKHKLTNTEQETIMARKTAAAPVADLDDLEGLDDIDLDDDTDDETPAPAAKPKRSRSRKAKAEPEVEADDDLELDDDEDEAPAAKPKRSRKAASDKKGPTPPTRALPEGKYGANEIGALAGVTGRDVRMFLRKKQIAVNAELGRYAFSKAQAEKIAKSIKAARAK